MTTGPSSLVKYETPVAISSKDRPSLADDDAAILHSVLPPREYEEDGALWVQSVSTSPATRHDVVRLRGQLDHELERRRVNSAVVALEELYGQCFDELIRQVTINCAERGRLLHHVRNETRMTIKAYQTLFESSIAFGLRKTLCNEEERSEQARRIAELETERTALQDEDWKCKCAAIEKREGERREQDVQKHREEVDYLESYAQQLKEQLEALTTQP